MALVNSNKGEIAFLNRTNRTVKLNQNTYIADLEPLESVHHIAPQSPTLPKGSELPEHLCTLLDKITDETSLKENNQIINMLEFQDIFLGPDGKLGHTELVEYSIDTGSENPIKILPADYFQDRKKLLNQIFRNNI